MLRARTCPRHRTAAWTAGILFALLLAPVAAHETDQYTLPVGREFADLGPHLSRNVLAAVVAAVNETNAAIGQSLWQGQPTRQTAALQSPEAVAARVQGRLFAAFPTNEILDGRLADGRTRARYPGSITTYRPEQAIHDDPLLLLDVTKAVRSLFRAGTVSVDGTAFGTDKIVHFIHLGHIYYSSYLAARGRGIDEPAALDQAVRLSTGNNLLLSENWFLGMLSTGIRSNADLAANYAGFKFYRNLTETVRIGPRAMPPILVRDGPYFRLNDHVRPDSDFFTAFITPHWNEALNPSRYEPLTRARMRALLRVRCPDLLDWYRDEHGRRRTQGQFAGIHAELSTLYGEPYGYRSDGDSAVSIANTCFPSTLAHAVAPAASLDRHASTSSPQSVSSTSLPDRGVDELGRTPLWWAARDGRREEVERLLARGADPNAADVDGEGPLHAAARWGRVDVIDALLARGADPELRALYGATPLQVAAREAQTAAVRALLAHGADAGAADAFGSVPLHAAAARGDLELAALLLDYGADAGAADHGGRTPRQAAAQAGNPALLAVLRTHESGKASPVADGMSRPVASRASGFAADHRGYRLVDSAASPPSASGRLPGH